MVFVSLAHRFTSFATEAVPHGLGPYSNLAHQLVSCRSTNECHIGRAKPNAASSGLRAGVPMSSVDLVRQDTAKGRGRHQSSSFARDSVL